MRVAAKQARGAERTALLERLAALDTVLLDAAAQALDDEQARSLRGEAEAEIAPFAARMTADARESAVRAALDRLIRDAAGLPVVKVP